LNLQYPTITIASHQEVNMVFGAIRAGLTLVGFVVLTLPLMPVQALLRRVAPRQARLLPHWYHRQICRLIGVRLHIDGTIEPRRPVLLVANHSSWLDIPVLSAVAPLSFIAKSEVSRWPFVGTLARLQGTVFVDRTRRHSVGGTASEVGNRLAGAETIVLFAEGTSSDGNRLLPLRSSLVGAVELSGRDGPMPAVQTLALVYTHQQGLPLGRADRPAVSWYGDMDLGPHAWTLLQGGPIDVSIRIGAPLPAAAQSDRKALTRAAEAELRGNVIKALRGLPADAKVTAVTPVTAPVRMQHAASAKWS
jgi:lyso-ornithine lipid O-acyltransferase